MKKIMKMFIYIIFISSCQVDVPYELEDEIVDTEEYPNSIKYNNINQFIYTSYPF